MQSYSIASRCVCDKCHIQPKIQSAEGSEILTITVKCHGEMETKTIQKSEMVFTQHFFEQPANA